MRALLLAVLLITPTALIGQTTGNDLAEKCSDGEKNEPDLSSAYKAGICSGYILAVYKMTERLCGTENVTNGQLIKITRKYLDVHPEELNQPAEVLVERSLRKAFSCSPSK